MLFIYNKYLRMFSFYINCLKNWRWATFMLSIDFYT